MRNTTEKMSVMMFLPRIRLVSSDKSHANRHVTAMVNRFSAGSSTTKAQMPNASACPAMIHAASAGIATVS